MVDALFTDSLLPRQPQELAPGVIHLPGWLTVEQQDFWLLSSTAGVLAAYRPTTPKFTARKCRLSSPPWAGTGATTATAGQHQNLADAHQPRCQIG